MFLLNLRVSFASASAANINFESKEDKQGQIIENMVFWITGLTTENIEMLICTKFTKQYCVLTCAASNTLFSDLLASSKTYVPPSELWLYTRNIKSSTHT